MRRAVLIFFIAGTFLSGWHGHSEGTSPPRVLLIIVDGLRADAVTAHWTPYLSFLMSRGAYALNAHATMPSVTIANITSMLTGQTPGAHGHAITASIRPHDTAPTILAALGIPIPEEMDESVIRDIVPDLPNN